MKINKIDYKPNFFIQIPHDKKQNVAQTNPLNADAVMNFMGLQSVFFKGNSDETSFEDTIANNYFRLPKVQTKNGNIIQALPDKTQLASAKSLYDGKNTVCIAPTGTGKTAIANYAITKNLKENKKTIYTTPLKALSNDKYREFCKIYGEENVGLLTGDIKLKKDAPIVIMTTEIYRNMALASYAQNDEERFKGVKTAIFDEAHYISEDERGKIWEESIMLTPKNVQILPLSATIGNGVEFASWIESVSKMPTKLIEASPKDRHVPLVYYNYAGNKKDGFSELIKGKVDINLIENDFAKSAMSQRQIRALDMLYQAKYAKDDDYSASLDEQKEIIEALKTYTHFQKVPHIQFANIIKKEFALKELKAQEITQLLIDSNSKSINNAAAVTEFDKKANKNDYNKLVRSLKNADKLPALIFIFSRANCNDASAILADGGLNLTTQKEKDEIKKIIKDYKDKGIYLGKNFSEHELMHGVASHHAGLLPAYKKLVEELFSKKLVKTVFATSTLSAGINMPAKTVVITSIDHPHKNDLGEMEYVLLSANEFHQMSGRAGRRGIDPIGNVVLYNLRSDDEEKAKELILKAPDKATSKFNPSYSFLPSYYQKCEDDKLLDYFQDNTLKVFQAADKKKARFELHEEFEKYKEVLLSKGYLEKTERGIQATPKGKMLTKAHGYNHLTLVEMMTTGALKNLSPVELAAFAASMTAEKQEDERESDDKLFANYLMENDVNEKNEAPLIEALDKAMDFDDEISIAQRRAQITSPENMATGVFESFVAFEWARKNSLNNNDDSIKNFRTLGNEILGKKSKKSTISPYTTKKFEDGNVYRILAQSIDVLKQIINISEFAIESCEFEDTQYYEDLIEKSNMALELIKQPPVYDALSIG